jgi:hypothetical protein
MVSTGAQTMDGHQGWITKAAALPDGKLHTVTATDPKEVQHIRRLGFIGLLASGEHHQMHHLMIAHRCARVYRHALDDPPSRPLRSDIMPAQQSWFHREFGGLTAVTM